MRIEDFNGVQDATSDEDIEEALAKRYGEGVNEFWLSHADNRFPAMSILVKGNISALHFFQKDQDPGMTSIGGGLNFEIDGTTTFYMNSTEEEQEIPNGMLVPFPLALKAAKEFAAHREPPECIEWFVL